MSGEAKKVVFTYYQVNFNFEYDDCIQKYSIKKNTKYYANLFYKLKMNFIFFGLKNSGKSTIINTLTNNQCSIDKNNYENYKKELINYSKEIYDFAPELFSNNSVISNFPIVKIDHFSFIKNEKQYNFYETYNVFDYTEENELLCIKKIEYVIKKINNVNAIFLCVEAHEFGISENDKKILTFFDNFSILKNKINIIFTKTDKIKKDLKPFFLKNISKVHYSYVLFDNLENNSWINSFYLIYKYNESKFNYFEYFDKREKLTIIENVQKIIKNNNYYPFDNILYSKKYLFYIFLFICYLILINIFILIVNYYILHTINLYINPSPFFFILYTIFYIILIMTNFILSVLYYIKWFIYCVNIGFNKKDRNIIGNNKTFFGYNLLMVKINQNIKLEVTKNTIYYTNLNKFYDGLLFGNEFLKGTFYYPNGKIMYKLNN